MLLYFRRLFNKEKIRKVIKVDYFSDHYVNYIILLKYNIFIVDKCFRNASIL